MNRVNIIIENGTQFNMTFTTASPYMYLLNNTNQTLRKEGFIEFEVFPDGLNIAESKFKMTRLVNYYT